MHLWLHLDALSRHCRKFSINLSCRGWGIFLALRNTGCDPGVGLTCALYRLIAGSFSSLTVLMPFWSNMTLPSSQNFLADCTTMLMIPETSVDDHHRPQDVWFFRLTEVYQAQSRWKWYHSTISTRIKLHCYFLVFNLLYSDVADMSNTFSRVQYISMSISEDVWPDILPSSSQKLMCWSDSPDPSWVLFFAHFREVSQLFTGVTFLVQSRTGFASVWPPATSITQTTLAFTTIEIFTWFPESLFEVESHFFVHWNRFITCWGTLPLLDYWTASFLSF